MLKENAKKQHGKKKQFLRKSAKNKKYPEFFFRGLESSNQSVADHFFLSIFGKPKCPKFSNSLEHSAQKKSLTFCKSAVWVKPIDPLNMKTLVALTKPMLLHLMQIVESCYLFFFADLPKRSFFPVLTNYKTSFIHLGEVLLKQWKHNAAQKLFLRLLYMIIFS